MKKIIYSLIIIILGLIIFPSSAFAVTDIAVYKDEEATPVEYLIFPSDGWTVWTDCRFMVNDNPSYYIDGTEAYLPCIQKTKNGKDYPAVPVSLSASLNPTVRYLWFSDGSMFDLRPASGPSRFDTALTTEQVKYFGSEEDLIGTTKRITATVHNPNININVQDYGYLLITDDRYDDDIYYLIFKAVDISGKDPMFSVDDEILYTLFQKLSKDKMDKYDPYTAIKYMSEFRDKYEELKDAREDIEWIKLGPNKQIKEPDAADWNDVYIIWIRTGSGEEAVYDIQVMTCARRPWKDADQMIGVLPRTGMDYFLESLLVANAVVLPFLFYKKRKLEKIK